MSEWLRPDPNQFPELLKQHARWVIWLVDGTGNKAPRSVRRPEIQTKANLSINWGTFESALAVVDGTSYGFGYVLGPVKDGPTFSGVDLDKCRDPLTGKIEPWAWRIIKDFNTYTEVSPSGTGVKLFLLGSLPDDASQGKIHKVEIYDRDRYFTVTGLHVEGTPKTVEFREERLCALHEWLWSRDLVKIVKFFDYFISDSGDTLNMRCPWADTHSSADKPQDAGLQMKDGRVAGFHCFHAGCSEKKLPDVRRFFGLGNERAGVLGFRTDSKDRTLKEDQYNIRHAIDLMDIKLSYNMFTKRNYLTSENRGRYIDDSVWDNIWLQIDTMFGFLPSQKFFRTVSRVYARANSFHPILNYLNALVWDGKPRLDEWLVKYAGAKDSPYVRAISAIPLIAAVRRIRRPETVKFDEILVLESVEQGKDKSQALAALCEDKTWFTDSFSFDLKPKEVIEQTIGKWIIEVSELSGQKMAGIEHLKAMLSRQSDTARLAYREDPETIDRGFIIIGTTNSEFYLTDPTGNRRFWPVRIEKFNLDALRVDKDQIWAEAAHRESQNESIRLDESLWEAAAVEQEKRREVTAWEMKLSKFFCCSTATYRVSYEELFEELQVPIERQNRASIKELSAAMKALGFRRVTISPRRNLDGKHKAEIELQVKEGLEKQLLDEPKEEEDTVSEFRSPKTEVEKPDYELAAKYAMERSGWPKISGWGRGFSKRGGRSAGWLRE